MIKIKKIIDTVSDYIFEKLSGEEKEKIDHEREKYFENYFKGNQCQIFYLEDYKEGEENGNA
jgi:hypothetical protein